MRHSAGALTWAPWSVATGQDHPPFRRVASRAASALGRNELGALLAAAGLGPPLEHALISLLALTGLRVSETTGADIEHLGLDRGHRTLTISRKGDKVVTIPLVTVAPTGPVHMPRRSVRRTFLRLGPGWHA